MDVTIRVSSSRIAFVFLAACASASRQRVDVRQADETGGKLTPCAATIDAATSSRALAGAEDRVPPGCSPMHGGLPEIPNAPARWFLSTTVDSVLDRQQLGRLVVRVESSMSNARIEAASVHLFVTPQSMTSGVRLDAAQVRFDVRASRYHLLARRLGNTSWSDLVTVRQGYVDTLVVGLGRMKICFT